MYYDFYYMINHDEQRSGNCINFFDDVLKEFLKKDRRIDLIYK